MRIARTIPPAASPITVRDLLNGFRGFLRQAEEIRRFERELKGHFGIRHCFSVSSGKAALTMILGALHDLYPARSEVVIPAFCCYSVPSAVVRAGLKVVLCDVDPETLDFDFAQLARVVSKRRDDSLLAVVPVHLFGLSSDIDRVRTLVDDPHVAIVEDAAQVMGAEHGGRKMGTVGDAGFFSLGRGKALSTVEGGVVVTDRCDIAAGIRRRMTLVPEYGGSDLIWQMVQAIALMVMQRPSFFWLPKSIPFLKVGGTFYEPDFRIRKMSAFHAGLARNWRNKLTDHSRARVAAAAAWSRIPWPDGLSNYSRRNGKPIHFIRYPLHVKDPGLWRDLLECSQTEGLGIMLTYPNSIDEIPELKDRFAGQGFPGANRLAREILTLPVHPLLSGRDRNRIERAFGAFFTGPETDRTRNRGESR